LFGVDGPDTPFDAASDRVDLVIAPAGGELTLDGVELRQGDANERVAPLAAEHRPSQRPICQRLPDFLASVLEVGHGFTSQSVATGAFRSASARNRASRVEQDPIVRFRAAPNRTPASSPAWSKIGPPESPCRAAPSSSTNWAAWSLVGDP
jgi:hypothetical protein